MSTLAEIEAAADQLLPQQQQELLLFLAARLHGVTGPLPALRDFSFDQIQQWIAEDEAGQQRFMAGA